MKFFNTALVSLILSTSFFVSNANAGIILDEDFDPITASDWTISNGTVVGNPVSEFFDGNALLFDGKGKRSAATNAFDLTTGGLLSFMLKIGGSNDTVTFEDADSGEDVLVQYSTNSTSWIDLLLIDTEDLLYKDTWGEVNISISGLAASNSTSFQFIQVAHSGTNWDNWAIDDVTLSNNVAVPEPTTFAVFALGIAGLASRRFNKKV
jgi:hypothetical protein